MWIDGGGRVKRRHGDGGHRHDQKGRPGENSPQTRRAAAAKVAERQAYRPNFSEIDRLPPTTGRGVIIITKP